MLRIVLAGTVFAATVGGLTALADSRHDLAALPEAPAVTAADAVREAAIAAPAIPARVRLEPRAVDADFDLDALQRQWRDRPATAADVRQASNGT